MSNVPNDPWGIIGLLVFIIFILVDKLIVPQFKKRKNGNRAQRIYVSSNPHSVSLEAFYQAFKDHDENQEKCLSEIKTEMTRIWKAIGGEQKRIDDLDKRILIIERTGKP